MSKEVHMIRPPDKAHRELYRYNDGEWVPDDGRPDLAFYGLTADGWPYAYYKTLSPLAHCDHPNELAGRAAMRACCDKYGCANGRGVK